MIYALDKKGSPAQNTKTAVHRSHLPLIAVFCAFAFIFASCDTATNETQTGKPDPTGITLSYSDVTLLTGAANYLLPVVSPSTTGTKAIKGTTWAVKSGTAAQLNTAKTHIVAVEPGEAVFTVSTTTPKASQDITVTVRKVSHMTLSKVTISDKALYGVGEPFPIPDLLTYTINYTSGDPDAPKMVTEKMITKRDNKMLPWSEGDTGTTPIKLYVYDAVTGLDTELGGKEVQVRNFVVNAKERYTGFTYLKDALENAVRTGGEATITQYAPEANIRSGDDVQDLSIGSGISIVTLKGYATEKKIIQVADLTVFTIPANVTLILGEKITLEGRTTTDAQVGPVNPVVTVNAASSTFVMKPGSKITKWFGTAAAANGALNVSAGTAIIDGGEITGNDTANRAWNSAGIVVVNGNAPAKLIMNGGSISNNNSDLEYINDVLLLCNVANSSTLTLAGDAYIEKLGLALGWGVSFTSTSKPISIGQTWMLSKTTTLNVTANVGGVFGTIFPTDVVLFSGSVGKRTMGYFTPGTGRLGNTMGTIPGGNTFKVVGAITTDGAISGFTNL